MCRCFSKRRILFTAAIVFSFLFTGCKTVKETIEVPVFLRDTIEKVRIDTVSRVDTVINNTETIIREANESDSLMLAQLGLQIKDNEKIILVLRKELEQKISELYHLQKDSTYNHNETPVPVHDTQYVEVEKPLGWWQKLFLWTGVVCFGVLIGYGMWKTKNWWWELFKKIIK